MNSIKIDLDILKILNLNINHLLTLIKIYFTTEKEFFDYDISQEDIDYLRKEKYIMVYTDTNLRYFIRDKGNIILKKVVEFNKTKEATITLNTDEKDHIAEFNKKIREFREKFNGLRIGSMGTLSSVKSKLERWMKNNPDVLFNEILEATQLYIDSLNGDWRYLQRADYFIYKQNSRKEETSRLSIFIEEGRKETVNSDWGANIT